MWQKAKEKWAKFRLLQEVSQQQRDRQFFNIEEARSIGILFHAGEKEDIEFIKKIVLNLKEQGKKVHAIGYFPSKFTPQNFSYPKTEFDFFNQKETNFWNEPTSPYIHSFISEIRDILIDFNLHQDYPLYYIAAKCHAKCKIGLENTDTKKTHDVLIPETDTITLKTFSTHVEKILKQINNANL